MAIDNSEYNRTVQYISKLNNTSYLFALMAKMRYTVYSARLVAHRRTQA